MGFWGALSNGIDRINQLLAKLASWMILLSCVVSAINTLLRYGLDISNNWPLELQWYLFAAAVMLSASYTLKRNEHVRVDLIYSQLSDRGRIYIDLFGLILFLIPACLLFTWLSWTTLFYPSWIVSEQSLNAGGLLRYPIKFVVPFGFFMLSLQGISEIIKRIGMLKGKNTLTLADLDYEKPMQ
jgi:TRAP-type mannitol/chloroaromatic compound transport system permease small subunit